MKKPLLVLIILLGVFLLGSCNYYFSNVIYVTGTVSSYKETTCTFNDCTGDWCGPARYYKAFLPVISFNFPSQTKKYIYTAQCNEGFRDIYQPKSTHPVNSTTTLKMIKHPFGSNMIIATPDESLILR